MTGRPDDGYRVAARIASRSSRRGRVAAILATVAVVAWGAAVVGDRLGDSSPTGSEPGHSGGVAVATPSPIAAGGSPGQAGPTFPPTVEIRQDVPLGRIPIVLGSLAWIDPAQGTLQRSRPEDVRQFTFQTPDRGVACVCVEAGTPTAGPALRLDTYNLIGNLVSVQTIPDWLPNGQPMGLEDAVLVPDGSAAAVASFVAVRGGWDLRVQRIPFEGTTGVVEGEGPIDLPTNTDPARLVVRAALAPDGSRLRVSIEQLADDLAGISGSEQSWDVDWDGSAWGAIQAVPPLGSEVPPAVCLERAWATPTTFIEGCTSQRVQDDGSQEALLRIDDGSGVIRDIGLGFLQFPDSVGWVVDGSHGVAYGWSSISHHLYRIELPSGNLTLRVLGQGTLGGLSNIIDLKPEASPPPAGPQGVEWQATSRASEAQDNPLVGSSDGSLLYATGLAYPTGPAFGGSLTSTGIWVFDARSLAVVAHWVAAAAYDQIAFNPSGRYVIAVGEPNGKELSQFGNHGPELVIHDAIDGSVVAILRSLALAYGGIPGLLPPGPPAKPVPGSG